MEFKTGIGAISDLYDVFILDIWGVIHDGVQPYASVEACLEALHSAGKKVVFLSNMPRRGRTALEALQKMGLGGIALDQILTSGDAIMTEMTVPGDAFFKSLKNPLNFYQIGHVRNPEFLEHVGLSAPQEMSAAEYVLLTLFTEEGEETEAFLAELDAAARLGLPVVCANPDIHAPHGGRRRLCAGHYAAYYAAQGGEVVYYGKPHKPVYDILFTRLKEKGFSDKHRFLMVGDTPETDVLGATRAGIDAALVLSGVLSGEPPEVLGNLEALGGLCQKRAGCTPRWILPGLIW